MALPRFHFNHEDGYIAETLDDFPAIGELGVTAGAVETDGHHENEHLSRLQKAVIVGSAATAFAAVTAIAVNRLRKDR